MSTADSIELRGTKAGNERKGNLDSDLGSSLGNTIKPWENIIQGQRRTEEEKVSKRKKEEASKRVKM